MFELIGVLTTIFVVAGVFIALVVKNLLYIGRPDEVLIFAGINHRRPLDKKIVGYRCIVGGRTIKKPFLEKVSRLDLSNMNINVEVENAFSKGGIPVCVQGVANLKIASDEPYLGNAIERFLGRNRAEIMKIAKETLEGNLRGVLATLTPEQVNEDKIAFAQNLIEEAENDLNKLGLKLDSLKIQNVWDNVDYLNSLGRVQNARVRQEARIAEAEAKSLAMVRTAENQMETELKKIEALELELKAEIERKIADQNTKKDALVKQEVGVVKAEISRVEAEAKVQLARIEQVKRQLQADVVTPAQAQREQMIAQAKAASATILENGKATAEAMQHMIEVWKKAGPNAKDVFLMQKLEHLMKMMVSTIQEIKVNRLVLLQTGEGSSITKQLIGAAEQLKSALGIDITSVIQPAVPEEKSSTLKSTLTSALKKTLKGETEPKI
ncbi:flotillin family protein [bacterium]|nr:flotillin family protein [bacterium]